MNRNEQIENANRQVEIAQNNLMVAEANLKRLKESKKEIKMYGLWIKETTTAGIRCFTIGLNMPYTETSLIPDLNYKVRDCFTIKNLREIANGILEMIGDR